MPLLNVIFILAGIGVILYLFNRYVPMQATIKKILNVVVVIAVILWLLHIFGALPNIANVRVGK
jgi:hypothetical protein